jgi:hypothetical protein
MFIKIQKHLFLIFFFCAFICCLVGGCEEDDLDAPVESDVVGLVEESDDNNDSSLLGAAGNDSDDDEHGYVDAEEIESDEERPSSFDPLVVGNNTCYMIHAYFPKDTLKEILPVGLTIPDDAVMSTYYPDTKLKQDAHPIMMSFCHGSEIHDVLTNQNVPEQEEIMFLFPVIYETENGDAHLCSYLPVLYLDSIVGVAGGLMYGLRKEFHPKMKNDEVSDTSGWWHIDTCKWWHTEEILDASFVAEADQDLEELPNFFEQTLANPFVTLSYPTPTKRMVFYEAKVYTEKNRNAQENFYWNYKGSTVQNGLDTQSVFSKYFFTMSSPMNAGEYFQAPKP